MGYIKEPKGIDFVVDPIPLTEKDKVMISKVIAHYKATGRKKRIPPKKQLTKKQKI
ncbi:hypothetical protein CLV51_1011612 [Chitinophaga niastensis]|uniref:Uncharacterized protein n=1 Tax=Chitinophaga niastensis TaxID=536980 RepID=A0A2P8HVQ8_CHINA|nr:hypothetical protein [Chitinophaga niastensis]PSL50268.1 hypothetical protein CLV51_1011612 [Chitinophaga niastensis]